MMGIRKICTTAVATLVCAAMAIIGFAATGAAAYADDDTPIENPSSFGTLDGPAVVEQGQKTRFTYSKKRADGPKKDWIAIYAYDNECRPTNETYHCGSETWTQAPNGNAAGEHTVELDTSQLKPGRYLAYYLWNDGYTLLADQFPFSIHDPEKKTTAIPRGNDTIEAPITRVGQQVSQNILGYWDNPRVHNTFILDNAPDWLQIDENGMLVGTPNEPGSYTVTVKLKDDASQSLRVSFVVRKAGEQLVQHLRAMTWNMWYGGTQVNDYRTKQIRLAVQAGVDIIGFEESYSTTGIELGKALGWHYAQSGYDHSMISKYPITRRSNFQSDNIQGSDVSSWVQLDLDPNGAGQPLIFSVSHLWYTPMAPDWACKMEKTNDDIADMEMNGERGKGQEAKNFLEVINGPDWSNNGEIPVISVGDFNSVSSLDWTEAAKDQHCGRFGIIFGAHQAFMDAGFVDTYREAHPDPVQDPGVTWSPVVKQDQDFGGKLPEPQDRIDFIFYRQGSKSLTNMATIDSQTFDPGAIETHAVPDTSDPAIKDMNWTSDHAAVISTIDLTGKTPNHKPKNPVFPKTAPDTSIEPDPHAIDLLAGGPARTKSVKLDNFASFPAVTLKPQDSLSPEFAVTADNNAITVRAGDDLPRGPGEFSLTASGLNAYGEKATATSKVSYNIHGHPTFMPVNEKLTATAAKRFSFKLSTQDFDGIPVFSTSDQLPKGLSLNGKTGEISGIPTTATTARKYVIAAKGKDFAGNEAITELTLQLAVKAAPIDPNSPPKSPTTPNNSTTGHHALARTGIAVSSTATVILLMLIVGLVMSWLSNKASQAGRE